MPTTTKKWEDLSDDEKLEALTTVLTRAGSDLTFRDQCLVSKDAAKAAIEEAGQIQLPTDFNVEFLTRVEAHKRLIFYIPDFKDTEPPINHPAEEFTPCSYSPWAPRSKTPQALQDWLNAM